MSVNSLEVTLPSPTEVVMSRVFDAPRDLVWRAMTEADLLTQWWGQKNSQTRIDTFDLRVGGKWRFVEVGASGDEHAFRGEFLEISPPDRLVYTFEYEPMAGHIVTDTISLEEIDGGKTRMTATGSFQNQEDRDGMVEAGMERGAAESYDRLEALLATLQQAD